MSLKLDRSLSVCLKSAISSGDELNVVGRRTVTMQRRYIQ